MYAKYYENPTMLCKVTAKNVGDFFLRHTVVLTDIFQKRVLDVNRLLYNVRWPIPVVHQMYANLIIIMVLRLVQ